MYYFYFDASALVKRYTEELGSDKIDYLFDNVPLNRLKCLTLGAAEAFWICVRKKNDGRITPHEFTHAVVNLTHEVTSDASDFYTATCSRFTCLGITKFSFNPSEFPRDDTQRNKARGSSTVYHTDSPFF